MYQLKNNHLTKKSAPAALFLLVWFRGRTADDRDYLGIPPPPGSKSSMHPRQLLKSAAQLLSMAMVLTSCYMAYTGLGLIAGTGTPAVVVLSGSMEPAFQRGDILFMWNRKTNVKVGDVVVYQTDKRDIPIVHRVLRDHHTSAKQLVLTKGDNNVLDDLDLYPRSQSYLERAHDINGGVVWGYLPKIGYATILMSENPMLRTIFLGSAVLLQFLQND